MRAVNLIPAEQRSGSAVGTGRSEGGAHAVLALVAGLAVLALLYGIAHHQIASRRAEAASVTAQAQQAQTAADRLAPYASFIALREQRTQAVSTLVDSRFDWAHVFHEFGRVLPLQVSIASLTGTVGSASPVPVPASATPGAAGAAASAAATSATPPGSVPTFTLVGCATSQPAVALMLERLHLMDGVRTVTLQSSAKASSAGSSGGCPSGSPPGDPSFSVQISFDPLPSASAAAASAKAVTVSTAPGAKAATPTTAGKSSK